MSITITRLIERLKRAEKQAETPVAEAIFDAIRALEEYRDIALPLGHRLATLLDAAQPLLDRAAEQEARKEFGKRMREISQQSRAQGAREATAQAQDVFGYQP